MGVPRFVDIAPLAIEADRTNPFGEFSHFFKFAFDGEYAVFRNEAPVFACLSQRPVHR